MFQRFFAALCIALLVLASSTVAVAATKSHRSGFLRPTPLQMKEWTWVGWCETHDSWSAVGPLYTGALGITRTNWVNYEGTQFSTLAAHAKPWQQVIVAMRINRGWPVPDQPIGTCGKGW